MKLGPISIIIIKYGNCLIYVRIVRTGSDWVWHVRRVCANNCYENH